MFLGAHARDDVIHQKEVEMIMLTSSTSKHKNSLVIILACLIPVIAFASWFVLRLASLKTKACRTRGKQIRFFDFLRDINQAIHI